MYGLSLSPGIIAHINDYENTIRLENEVKELREENKVLKITSRTTAKVLLRYEQELQGIHAELDRRGIKLDVVL